MLIFLGIGLIVGIILRNLSSAFKSPDDNDPSFYDGPVPTPLQEKANKEAMIAVIEQHPDGVLAKSNPHLVEEYLNEVKLDLPPGVHTL